MWRDTPAVSACAPLAEHVIRGQHARMGRLSLAAVGCLLGLTGSLGASAEQTNGWTAAMANSTRPSDEELRTRLTPEQYEITQREGTEPPFRNAYWDNKKPGIYVDVVSGEPLFGSLDKFDSGTGWPSFTRPLEPANIS